MLALVSFFVSDTLEIIDISDPNNPVFIGNDHISDGRSIQIVGNYAFGTGELLVTLSGTSGFVGADVNVNLFGANFLFS
ncbi:hypothetical protein [Anabaena catenula]|uniref:IPT/TIG domain-containing protein n=1 Tax=Anabaena catenula FACHB-362 TaxID=2692877 RepID=A0ABR8J6Z9_9NOST|nr:hypothetical protein [Anabaena catenula]MBD2693360.1 hypothetical protein [Anabaena catenula FACHB-362]